LIAEEARRSFPARPESIGDVRRFVSDSVGGATPEELEVLVLLASEVATNAVRFARGPTFEVEVRGGSLAGALSVHVGVTDSSPELPEPKPADDSVAHGRGLLLVDALAAHWGVAAIAGDGKTVWFEL
jgi:anti-sigma regulatory factor (Ser/Thr protein kinase)